jgi:polyhydroxybutyrate depolymerase
MNRRAPTALALLAALAGCAGDAVTVAAADASSAAEVATPVDAPGAPEVGATDVPAVDEVVDVGPPRADAGACAGRGGAPGDREQRVRVGGVERVYRVHVPRSYDPARPAMLVFNFHGYLSNEAQQADWSNLDAAADTRGFVAVHPRGRDTSWNAGVCCGAAMTRQDDDVGFVRAMLAALEAELCVDRRRVFATGFSNGAFFANRLACELSDRIAAVAPVAGLVGVTPCAPPRPVPVLNFHGDADLVVPYQGSPVLGFPAVTDSMRGWAARNGCGAAATEVLRRGDARCVSFTGCAAGAEVILCTLSGGGHTWPGGDVSALGGRTSRDLDATRYLLDFFERHPLP